MFGFRLLYVSYDCERGCNSSGGTLRQCFVCMRRWCWGFQRSRRTEDVSRSFLSNWSKPADSSSFLAAKSVITKTGIKYKIEKFILIVRVNEMCSGKLQLLRNLNDCNFGNLFFVFKFQSGVNSTTIIPVAWSCNRTSADHYGNCEKKRNGIHYNALWTR